MAREAITRLMVGDDLPAAQKIVNHYILTSTVHFGAEPESVEDWRARWQAGRELHPWLSREDGGEVVGVAYARPWGPREAFAWCVETAVYVAPGRLGQGHGRALYRRLLDMLRAQGYRSAVGVISLPNDASVALHQGLGFEPTGRLADAGFKHGGWHDVEFWQFRLAAGEAPPTAVTPVAELSAPIG